MFQKQRPNFGLHFKTFIVMATICPLGRPLGWKNTQKKTYFEILWGEPHEENQNKHGKTPTKKKKLYLETLWGEPHPEKQKMEEPKKYWKKKSWLEWLGAFSQKTFEKPKKNWRLFGEGPMEKTKNFGETKKR
jgi:hypothetical protein